MATPHSRVTADVRRIEFISLKVHVKPLPPVDTLDISRFPINLFRVTHPIALHHIAVLFQILLRFPGSIFQFVPARDMLRAHRPRKSSEKPVTHDGSRCGGIGVYFRVHVISSQVERWGHVREFVQDVSTYRPGQKVWSSLSLVRAVAYFANVY